VYNLDDFKAALSRKHLILAPWADLVEVEEAVKKETKVEAPTEVEVAKAKTGPTAHGEEPAHDGGEQGGEAGAKVLCIPFEQPEMPEGTKCFFSGAPAKNFALFGRSY
jgi:prolyl-tRNA synthetase